MSDNPTFTVTFDKQVEYVNSDGVVDGCDHESGIECAKECKSVPFEIEDSPESGV